MSTIDADTHIIESAAVWELMDPALFERRPVVVSVPGDTEFGSNNAFWLIEGRIVPKPRGKGGFRLHTPSDALAEQTRSDTTVEARELRDVDQRLSDMDSHGIDVQVVYPTLMLNWLTDDPVLDVGITSAYGKFLSHIYHDSKERIRWVVRPPISDIAASVEQIHDGKQGGAVGVVLFGYEGTRSLADPYFFPIYEACEALDLAVCVHSGCASDSLRKSFDFDYSSAFPSATLPVVVAFRDLVANLIPERFPKLRFGFLEAGSSWVPYVAHILDRSRRSRVAQAGDLFKRELPSLRQLISDYRLFIACEADEDLEYVMNYVPEQNLVIGSDYGHQDPAFEADIVGRIAARGDLSEAFRRALLSDNPVTLYGLEA